jgi:hypothetical protein
MIHGEGLSDGYDFHNHMFYSLYRKQSCQKYNVKPHFWLYFLLQSNLETIDVQGMNHSEQ